MPEFIFMFTHHDQTVPFAREAYRAVKDTGLRYAGFKDVGLPLADLRDLASEMRDGGQQVVLEIVNPTKAGELAAAENALTISPDFVMGGTHAAEVAALLHGSGIKFFPFPGRVINHPSDLRGSLAEIVSHARDLAGLPGVHGLDLLAYRWDGDVPQLMRAVVAAVAVPVVIAGSINSDERIRSVAAAGAWGFTIGSALLDGSYRPECVDLAEKVRLVLAAAGGTAQG